MSPCGFKPHLPYFIHITNNQSQFPSVYQYSLYLFCRKLPVMDCQWCPSTTKSTDQSKKGLHTDHQPIAGRDTTIYSSCCGCPLLHFHWEMTKETFGIFFVQCTLGNFSFWMSFGFKNGIWYQWICIQLQGYHHLSKQKPIVLIIQVNNTHLFLKKIWMKIKIIFVQWPKLFNK